MIQPYSVYLHLEVTETLTVLPKRERDQILRFFRSLIGDPFQEGDFQEYDALGRANQVKQVGISAIIFYVDDADRQIRILEVRRGG